MTERWEDFRDAFVQLDPEGQAYIRRLMAAYVARQEGKASGEDLALIAKAEAEIG